MNILLGAIIFAVAVFASLPSHQQKQAIRVSATGGWRIEEDEKGAEIRRARIGGYQVDDTPFEKVDRKPWQWSIYGGLAAVALVAFLETNWALSI